MLENKGDNVTLEIINRYGINLFRPFQIALKKEKRYIFYYYALGIEQLPDNKYKVFKHGLF